MPVRYTLYSKRRDNIFPFGPSVAPPKADTSLVDRISQEEKVHAGLKALRTEDAGRDTSFYRYRRMLLRFPALGVPLTLVTYNVPSGRVLQVENIEFVCTEPWLYGSYQIAWRLAINGQQIPHHSSQDGVRDDYLFSPLSMTTGNPPDVFPVFVPANAQMQIQVVEIDPVQVTSFSQYVWIMAAVKGRLRKPAGGNL